MKSNKLLLGCASLLGLCGLLVFALIFGQHYVEGKIRVSLDRAIERSADKYDIAYRNVKVSFLKRTVDINRVQITPVGTDKTILVDRFQVSDLDDASVLRLVMEPQRKTIPNSMRFSIQGLHLTPDIMGEKSAKPLAEFGYDEIKLSLSMGLKTDRQAQTFSFDDVNLEVADVGKLSTTWQFSSIELPPDEALGNPELMRDHMMKAWKKTALHMAEVRFTDLGLLAHVDAQLKKTGKPSLAQSMEMAAAFAGGLGGRGPAKAQFLQDAIPKVQDFIAHGGSIALRAKPASDMPLVQMTNPLVLMDPNSFATEIGLSVEVTHLK